MQAHSRTIVLVATWIALLPGVARATSYYVSPQGSDLNSGTSEASPWRTLVKVSSVVYQPGDVIRLDREIPSNPGGDPGTANTWAETLILRGEGTPTNPIVVTTYGVGPRPIIAPGTIDSTCLRIDGVGGWKIIGLELAYARWGVELRYDRVTERRFIWLEDLYIHHMTSVLNSDHEKYNFLSAAIALRHWTDETTGPTFLRDLTVKNVTIDHSNFGLWTGSVCEGQLPNGEPRCNADGFSRTGLWAYVDGFSFDNVIVTNAPQIGLSFIFVKNGSVTNSLVNDAGSAGWKWGTTGGLIARASNVVFDNLNIYNVSKGPQQFDGVGFDFEGGTDRITYRNAEIYATDGAGMLILDNGGNAGPNTNLWIENVRITHFGRLPGNSREAVFFSLTNLDRGYHTGQAKWSRFDDSAGHNHIFSTHLGNTAPPIQARRFGSTAASTPGSYPPTSLRGRRAIRQGSSRSKPSTGTIQRTGRPATPQCRRASGSTWARHAR